jgi:hypothetical protein
VIEAAAQRQQQAAQKVQSNLAVMLQKMKKEDSEGHQ